MINPENDTSIRPFNAASRWHGRVLGPKTGFSVDLPVRSRISAESMVILYGARPRDSYNMFRKLRSCVHPVLYGHIRGGAKSLSNMLPLQTERDFRFNQRCVYTKRRSVEGKAFTPYQY